jgi:hypothetical protein
MHDQGDEIAATLDRLHVGGWSVGDTAFHDVDRGGIIHVVIGSNGENQIRAEGATCREAWRRALCFTAHRMRDTLTLCPGVASTLTMSERMRPQVAVGECGCPETESGGGAASVAHRRRVTWPKAGGPS